MSVPDCFRFLSFTINILLKFLFVSTFYWMLKVVGFFCYIKFVHVIWQFHPRMKVRYFLMNQIYDLKTLEGLNMIWRLAQDLDLPEFWPYGHLKGPETENEALRNNVLSSLCPMDQNSRRHEKVPYFRGIFVQTITLIIHSEIKTPLCIYVIIPTHLTINQCIKADFPLQSRPGNNLTLLQ